jgi:hypothetical protein
VLRFVLHICIYTAAEVFFFTIVKNFGGKNSGTCLVLVNLHGQFNLFQWHYLISQACIVVDLVSSVL